MDLKTLLILMASSSVLGVLLTKLFDWLSQSRAERRELLKLNLTNDASIAIRGIDFEESERKQLREELREARAENVRLTENLMHAEQAKSKMASDQSILELKYADLMLDVAEMKKEHAECEQRYNDLYKLFESFRKEFAEFRQSLNR